MSQWLVGVALDRGVKGSNPVEAKVFCTHKENDLGHRT